MTTPDLAYLLGRAQLVEARVRTLVAQRRAGDPAPGRPVPRPVRERGDRRSAAGDGADRPSHPLASDARTALERPTPPRRRPVARRSDCAGWPGRPGSPTLDVELLLIALLPDLDSRFERLYGYLNDDVTRRRASVGLALQLAGESAMIGRRPGPARVEPPARPPRPDRRRGSRPAPSHPRSAGAGPGRRTPARRRRSRRRTRRAGRRRRALSGADRRAAGSRPGRRRTPRAPARDRSSAPARRSVWLPSTAAGMGALSLDLSRLAGIAPSEVAGARRAGDPRGAAARRRAGRRADRDPGRDRRRSRCTG